MIFALVQNCKLILKYWLSGKKGFNWGREFLYLSPPAQGQKHALTIRERPEFTSAGGGELRGLGGSERSHVKKSPLPPAKLPRGSSGR